MDSQTYDNILFLYNKYIEKAELIFNNNKFLYLISFFHQLILGFFLIYPVYIYIVNYRGYFNYVYLGMLLFLVVHWILLNSECSLVLLTKKVINPKYKAGDFYKGSIDFQYSFLKSKWSKIKKTDLLNEQYRFAISNIILYILVLTKLDEPVFKKILILFIFILIYNISFSQDINTLMKFYDNCKDRNNEIFNF